MREARIFKDNVFCGILREDEEGFHFRYDREYTGREDALPVSPTMPIAEDEYEKEMMFPVFDGLIPEGWLLDIASESWKIDRRDRVLLRGIMLIPRCASLRASGNIESVISRRESNLFMTT